MKSKFFGVVKRGPPGEIKKYKMRLVARGDQAQENINWTKSTAAVPTNTTINCLLRAAAVGDLALKQYDVEAAFLSTDIDNDNCYMGLGGPMRLWRFPDGKDRPTPEYDGVRGIELVAWIRRGLYGLRQGMRLFIAALAGVLAGLGLKQSIVDPCLFTKKTRRFEYRYPTSEKSMGGRPMETIVYRTESEFDGMQGGKLTLG